MPCREPQHVFEVDFLVYANRMFPAIEVSAPVGWEGVVPYMLFSQADLPDAGGVETDFHVATHGPAADIGVGAFLSTSVRTVDPECTAASAIFSNDTNAEGCIASRG